MNNPEPAGMTVSAGHERLGGYTRAASSARRAAYVARVLTDGERSVIADPQDALVLARVKRMPARRLARLDAMEPAGGEDRRLYGWLQLLWLRDEEYLLGTRLGRIPTHRELFADFARHRNGLRFRAYFALKYPQRVRSAGCRSAPTFSGRGGVPGTIRTTTSIPAAPAAGGYTAAGGHTSS